MTFLGSSTVEHPAVNRRVVGSNPTRGARQFQALWPLLKGFSYIGLKFLLVLKFHRFIHFYGVLNELHVKEYMLYDLLMYAQEIGFTGIGFYEKENFLHLDVRSGEKRIWKGKQLIGY